MSSSSTPNRKRSGRGSLKRIAAYAGRSPRRNWRSSWRSRKAPRSRQFHSSGSRPLRANIAETLLVHSITEQGGKEIHHEEYEDILSGPVGRSEERRVGKEC